MTRISVALSALSTSPAADAKDSSFRKDRTPEIPYVLFPFYQNDVPLQTESFPRWGMTLRAAGSMRFRWNETNSTRMHLLAKIASRSVVGHGIPVSLELIHSRTVYYLTSFENTFGLTGDGMITRNTQLIPVVTVADCMPLFLYDPVTGVFGALHSGWKGTGIAGEAVKLAVKKCGADPRNICFAIGPHIRQCCYVVDEERANYFRTNFTESCVTPLKEGEEPCRGAPAVSGWNNRGGKLYRLSLEKANLAVLDHAGVCDRNIVVADDCTCCTNVFGSFRRESSLGPTFTVQAAFSGFLR